MDVSCAIGIKPFLLSFKSNAHVILYASSCLVMSSYA